MPDLFEMLLYEAVNINTDTPVLISIGGATIKGELDSGQQCSSIAPLRYTRLLNASLVNTQHSDHEITLRVPRPPTSSAVALAGGPNRRWLVTIGTTIVSGEEVSWDQWLDYNSTTNGGGWDADLVAGLKHSYPLNADERAFFHFINVQFHSIQTAATLASPIHVPTGDVLCLGNQWQSVQ